MHFKSIIFTCLLPVALSKTTNCNSSFTKSQLEEVANIAHELGINNCDAGKVYTFINKNHKSGSCESYCKREVRKLNSPGIIKIRDDLINICEGKCLVNSKKVSEEVEEPNEKTKLEARATCNPINSADVQLVSSSAGFMGYPKYKDAGSVKTAVSAVNGCGPKSAVFGIDNNTMKKIPLLLDGTFEPGCNSHDICYACHYGSKKYCDTRLLTNLQSICDKRYNKKDHPFYNAGCKAQAKIFHAAVSVAGKNAYDGTEVNTSASCADCGVNIIRNNLVSYPFYV